MKTDDHQVSAKMPKQRRAFNSNVIILLVAAWITVIVNLNFWQAVWKGIDGWNNGNIMFLVSLPVFVIAFNYLILSLLAWSVLTRLMLSLILMVAAAASYFISRYGIFIDHTMLMNLMQTDIAEARDLLSGRLLVWVVCLGGLPALVVWRVRLARQTMGRALLARMAGIVGAVGLIGLILMTQYQSYASLLRNHREIRLLLVPSNVLGAVHGYAKRTLAKPERFEQVGLDAYQRVEVSQGNRHKLTILVVGETARAMNFSLNGYERPTNPQLASRDVISFTQVSSCGTATAVSVPCMFQDVDRADYKSSYAEHREGLLDVLQRAGVAVLWRDNNSGCKGACDRIPHEDLSHRQDAGICNNEECFDEVLLSGLQNYLDNLNRNAVVVLHMKGSHGPAYYKRYPSAFEQFGPACTDNQLDQCSTADIINAYDNSLLYTDHVLAQVIDLLKDNATRFDSAMLYVSDHGESLGEKGVYLHGVPYAMAPQEQTHVPMVAWFSPQFANRQGLSLSCLQQHRRGSFSHDNLFHSVLGLMGVGTQTYRSELDLFQPCLNSPQVVSHGQGIARE